MVRKRYEDSGADKAQDARGVKATGMTKAEYEKSARDKREDKAGEKRINVGAHTRRRPAPRPKTSPQALQPSFGLAQAPGEADEPDEDDEDLQDSM